MSMDDATLAVHHGAHYSHGTLGALDGLAQYRFALPALGGRKVPGKVFLQEALALTGAEISFNTLSPGTGTPFLHRHREHEEVYLFLRGTGEFQVDGELLEVEEGSVIRVAPPAARAFRNTGDEPLLFIVLQVKQDSLHAATVEDGVLLPDPPAWPSAATA
jgi:mannose-6-phosphate isomerase-like protein (cupin superfamily)